MSNHTPHNAVLVDFAVGNDQFAVICDGVCYSLHENLLDACDEAQELADDYGMSWDVTVSARNITRS